VISVTIFTRALCVENDDIAKECLIALFIYHLTKISVNTSNVFVEIVDNRRVL